MWMSAHDDEIGRRIVAQGIEGPTESSGHFPMVTIRSESPGPMPSSQRAGGRTDDADGRIPNAVWTRGSAPDLGLGLPLGLVSQVQSPASSGNLSRFKKD